jgi:NCS1 family nucleobase:cation symporter-1
VNLYSGAMATLTCNLKLPQWVTVTIGGVIGLVIALAFGGSSFMPNFMLFLTVISYYITPWLAVLLVDYFISRRSGRDYPPVENFYDPRGVFGRFGVPGLTALIVGIIVSIPFMGNGFYTGPIAHQLGGADFSYFVGAAVAAVIYGVWRPRSREPQSVVTVDRQHASATDPA